MKLADEEASCVRKSVPERRLRLLGASAVSSPRDQLIGVTEEFVGAATRKDKVGQNEL